MEIMRSLLFVPGHRQRVLEKALGLATDAAVFDLEDGVPPCEKDAARDFVAAAILSRPVGALRFVRVNATATGRMEPDLRAVVRPGLDGVVLPKVRGPDDVLAAAALLDRFEAEAGLQSGTLRVIASIESALGLVNAPAVAASNPRLVALLFGAEDLALDVGMFGARGDEGRDLLWARSLLALAAASRHLHAVDGVYTDLHDADGLLAEAREARRRGFSGKALVHPNQIATVNAVFSPTAGEVEYAREVVQTFDRAEATRPGALAFRGQMIDAPIVERARRILHLHGKMRPSTA